MSNPQVENNEVVVVGDTVGHHEWPAQTAEEVEAAYKHLQRGIALYMQSLVTTPKK